MSIIPAMIWGSKSSWGGSGSSDGKQSNSDSSSSYRGYLPYVTHGPVDESTDQQLRRQFIAPTPEEARTSACTVSTIYWNNNKK